MPFDRLNALVSAIIPDAIVKELNKSWIETPWIYINRWSIFHFIWGAIMPYFIGPSRPLYALVVHTVWEIIEYGLAYGGHPLFVEEAVDILWDTVIYMLGYVIVSKCMIIWKTYEQQHMKLPRYRV